MSCFVGGVSAQTLPTVIAVMRTVDALLAIHSESPVEMGQDHHDALGSQQREALGSAITDRRRWKKSQVIAPE